MSVCKLNRGEVIRDNSRLLSEIKNAGCSIEVDEEVIRAIQNDQDPLKVIEKDIENLSGSGEGLKLAQIRAGAKVVAQKLQSIN